MLKDFREFIARGNVVDLAVGVVIGAAFGKIVDSRHSLGNGDALKALLADAGFQSVQVDSFSHDVRLADGALFARLNAMAVIGMSAKGKTLNETERGELAGRIAADSQEAIARHTQNGAFVFPITTNIAIAIVA